MGRGRGHRRRRKRGFGGGEGGAREAKTHCSKKSIFVRKKSVSERSERPPEKPSKLLENSKNCHIGIF